MKREAIDSIRVQYSFMVMLCCKNSRTLKEYIKPSSQDFRIHKGASKLLG